MRLHNYFICYHITKNVGEELNLTDCRIFEHNAKLIIVMGRSLPGRVSFNLNYKHSAPQIILG